MKRIKSAILAIKEHWATTIFILLFVIISTLAILAFIPLKEKWLEELFYIVLVCALITGGLFGAFASVFPLLLHDKDMKTLKVLMILCVLLFFCSSLVLSQFVFVKESSYQEDVPYRVKSTMCYITDTGDCYHKSYCGYLHSKKKISITSARAQGYRPCSACWDDEYDIEYRKETITKREHNYLLSYSLTIGFWLGICIIILLLYRNKEKQLEQENREAPP